MPITLPKYYDKVLEQPSQSIIAQPFTPPGTKLMMIKSKETDSFIITKQQCETIAHALEEAYEHGDFTNGGSELELARDTENLLTEAIKIITGEK